MLRLLRVEPRSTRGSPLPPPARFRFLRAVTPLKLHQGKVVLVPLESSFIQDGGEMTVKSDNLG